MGLVTLEVMSVDLNSDGDTDLVFIYFNDVTEQLEVTARYSINPNNEDRVFGAIDRPNWNSGYENLKNSYKFCDGTTLVEFAYQLSFPYYRIVRTLGACGAEVCNIEIRTPFDYTEESSVGAADGSVRIHAITTDGAVEYSLNGVTWQLSNEFTGLTAGKYVAYARLVTAISCSDEVEFELPQPNDYGAKYTYTFNNAKGDECILSIKQLGYSGAVSVIDWATPNPVIHQLGKAGKSKFEPIYPSTLTFTPFSVTDFEYEAFQNSDDFTYQAELSVDGDVIFGGYLLSQLHKEPYTLTPYSTILIASDGLVLLKQFNFTNSDATKVKGVISLAEIIQICLDKLKFNLYSIVDALDLYAEGFTETRNTYTALEGVGFTESGSTTYNHLTLTGSTDYTSNFPEDTFLDLNNNDYGKLRNIQVLSSTYVGGVFTLVLDYQYSQDSASTWYVKRRDDEVSTFLQSRVDSSIFDGLNCYEVLEEIMKALGCSILQYEKKWYLVPRRLIGNVISANRFNNKWQYITDSDTIGANFDIDKTNHYLINQDAQYKNLFALQEVRVTQSFGTKSDLLKSGKFLADDFNKNGLLKEWSGTATSSRKSSETDDIYSISLTGQQNSVTDSGYLTHESDFLTDNDIDGYLELKFNYNVYSTSAIDDDRQPQIFVKLKATLVDPRNLEGSSGVELWLNNEGEFTTNLDYLILTVDKFNEWNNFSKLVRFIFKNAQFELTIYHCIAPLSLNLDVLYNILDTRYNDITLEFRPKNDAVPKKKTITLTNNTRSFKNKTDSYNTIIGDKDSTIAGVSVMRGVLRDKSDNYTRNWFRSGRSEAVDLTELVAGNYLANYERPSKVITGSVFNKNGNYPHPFDWVTESNLPNTKFMINHWKYDIRRCAFSFELIENLLFDETQVINNAYLLPNGNRIAMPNGNILTKEE